MKTWKSSTPELDPAPSIGRESCSGSRRRLLCDYVSLHIFVSELLVSLIAVSHVECVDLVSDVKSDDLDVSDDVLNVS